MNYYNDNDSYCAEWLRNLIAAGYLPKGHVDERPIQEVTASDIKGYTQCHWFAGIGGWSLALRLAGWPEDREVWTGSCPCQPFSAAGGQKGHDDPRHLAPVWLRLIQECRPSTIFGEQVAAAIRHGWLDALFVELEGCGYACGAAVLPACAVGAPHRRERLWFVADADQTRLGLDRGGGILDRERQALGDDADRCGEGNLGHAGITGLEGCERSADLELQGRPQPDGSTRAAGVWGDERLGHAASRGRGERGHAALAGRRGYADGANPWDNLHWLECRDGKARPTQPGIFPLAHGVPARVGKLRAAGNAIVPQVAAEFIKAVMQ